MGKKLTEMSLEELWELFPIILREHNDDWINWYHEENKLITSILNDFQIKRISHVGSTAINHIWAKPIVDIMIEIATDENIEQIKSSLENNNYLCMSQSTSRISLNKGYTENGFAERVFHLHIRYEGDNNELYFRDYLNDNPLLAKEYEELKLSLWKKYEHNRDGYTDAKSNFIEKCTKQAKEIYLNRY